MMKYNFILIFFPFSTVSPIYSSILYGQKKFKQLVGIDIIHSLIILGVCLILLYFSVSALWLVTAQTLMTWLLGLPITLGMIPYQNKGEFKKILVYGIQLNILSVFSTLKNGIDKIILGIFSGFSWF